MDDDVHVHVYTAHDVFSAKHEFCPYLKATLTGRGCREEFTIAARWAYKTKHTK